MGYKESFDRRNGTRELPQLQPVQKLKLSMDQSPRSYIIGSGWSNVAKKSEALSFPVPICYDTLEDDFPVPENSSESTPKDAQAEDTDVHENGNTSPTNN